MICEQFLHKFSNLNRPFRKWSEQVFFSYKDVNNKTNIEKSK